LLQQRHRNILENGVRTEKPDGIGPLYFDAAKTFQTLQPQQRARYFGQAPLLARSAARAYRPPWDRRERYPTTAEAGLIRSRRTRRSGAAQSPIAIAKSTEPKFNGDGKPNLPKKRFDL
jgi:hypothetical protein